jgi:hypothetical protein
VGRPIVPRGRPVANQRLLAALVPRLAFVAQTARRIPSAALIAWLPLVAELTRRLIGEGRTRSGQGEQAGE